MFFGYILIMLFVVELTMAKISGKESVMCTYDWFLVFGLLLLGLNEIISKAP